MDSKRHHGVDYVEIYVTDMEATKAFYGKAFGWQFTDYAPGYVGIKKPDDGEYGGFCLTDAVRPGGSLIVLYSNDVEASLASCRSADATISKDIFEFPGGRRFQFLDPSGNELAVWGD